MIDHLAADLGQRLGLGAGPIPDRDVMARLDEPLGHRETHAAHADPADFLRVFRGHVLNSCAVGRCPITGGEHCNGLATACPAMSGRTILDAIWHTTLLKFLPRRAPHVRTARCAACGATCSPSSWSVRSGRRWRMPVCFR